MGLLVQDRLQSASLILGVATLTGALTAGRTLLSMVAAPLAGTISDWLGSRWRVAAWGLTIGIIGMALVAWGESRAILAGVSLGAVASGSVQALVTALTGDLVSQAQRGRAIGLLHTAGRPGQRHRAAGRLRFDAVDWAARGVSALRGAVRRRVGADDAASATCPRRYVIRCQALSKVPGT